MLDFLREEGVSSEIISEIEHFRAFYKVNAEEEDRIREPQFRYYGPEVWEKAAAALLSGEHILLTGPKATGKNVLAQGLSCVFRRPEWDVSFHVNVDAASLIGADTFTGGEVRLREGPILLCAREGGFGVLDEINMAKNESMAVLHAILDFRRVIDVPGYFQVPLHEAARFIGTMNYGYAGTRELNEALASRFMVIRMPVISEEHLKKLLQDRYPSISDGYADQFAQLFGEIRLKCESGEISSRALDLRGLIGAIGLIREGLPARKALDMGLVDKCFDEYERQLVRDIVNVRIPESLGREKVFSD